MQHYICTGECAAISEKPGVCRSETCSKRGEHFEECDCRDGKHFGKRAAAEREREQKKKIE